MDSGARRHRWCLVVWLLLALLPLRGWAHAGMHLPAHPAHPAHSAHHLGAPAAAPAVPALDADTDALPCHAAALAEETVAHEGAAGGASAACALCDLCHGAGLPASADAVRAAYAPPRVETAAPLESGAALAPDRRPPRS